MTSFRTLLAAAAVVAVGSTLVAPVATAAPAGAPPAGSTTSSSPDIAPGARKAAPTRPQVGTCRTVTYKEAMQLADPDPAVPCTRTHTARTFKVLTPPRRVMKNLRLASRTASRGCSPAFRQLLGGTAASRAMTAYASFYYLPTKAQIRQGASWIRCDVVLYGDRALLPLPADVRIGSLPHPDSIALCVQATRRGYFTTACKRDHNYRAAKAFTLPFKRYPGRDKLVRIAQRRCPSLAGNNWFADWTPEFVWRIDDRVMTCYRKTRS